MGAVGALGAKAALLGGANGLACAALGALGPNGACGALAALGPETGACGALAALKTLCPAAGVPAAGVGAPVGLAPITGAPLPAGVPVNAVALNAVPGRCGTASPSWGATWSWAAATRSAPPAAWTAQIPRESVIGLGAAGMVRSASTSAALSLGTSRRGSIQTLPAASA